MADFDIYDDLDELHAQEEQKAAEELQWKAKYEVALEKIEKLHAEKKELNKKIKQLEANFTSLLETARAEVKRKDNQIAELRREKDDICFRRDVRPAKKHIVTDSSDEGRKNRWEHGNGNPFAHQPNDAQKVAGEKFIAPPRRQRDDDIERQERPDARQNAGNDRERDRSSTRHRDDPRHRNERNYDRGRYERERTKSSDSSRDEGDKVRNKNAPKNANHREDRHSNENSKTHDKHRSNKHETHQKLSNNGSEEEPKAESNRFPKQKISLNETSDSQRILSLDQEILEDVKQLKQKKRSEKSAAMAVENAPKVVQIKKSNEFLDALFDDMIVNDGSSSSLYDNLEAAQPTVECVVDRKQKIKKSGDITVTSEDNLNVELHLRTPLKQSVTKLFDNLFGPSPDVSKSTVLERRDSALSVGDSSDAMDFVPIAKVSKKETNNESTSTALKAPERSEGEGKAEETSLGSAKPAKTFKFAELDSSFYSSEEEQEKAKENATDTVESQSDIESPPFENFNTSTVSVEQNEGHKHKLQSKTNTSDVSKESLKNSQSDGQMTPRTEMGNEGCSRDKQPVKSTIELKTDEREHPEKPGKSEAPCSSSEKNKENPTKKDSQRHKSSTRSRSHKSSKTKSETENPHHSSNESTEPKPEAHKPTETEKNISMPSSTGPLAGDELKEQTAADAVNQNKNDALRSTLCEDNSTDLKLYQNQENSLHCDEITDEEDVIAAAVNSEREEKKQDTKSPAEKGGSVVDSQNVKEVRAATSNLIPEKISESVIAPANANGSSKPSNEGECTSHSHCQNVSSDVADKTKNESLELNKKSLTSIDGVLDVTKSDEHVTSITSSQLTYVKQVETKLPNAFQVTCDNSEDKAHDTPLDDGVAQDSTDAKVSFQTDLPTDHKGNCSSKPTAKQGAAEFPNVTNTLDATGVQSPEKSLGTDVSKNVESTAGKSPVKPTTVPKPISDKRVPQSTEGCLSRGRRKKSKTPRKCSDEEQDTSEIDLITSTVVAEHNLKSVDAPISVLPAVECTPNGGVICSESVFLEKEPEMAPLFVEEDSIDLPLAPSGTKMSEENSNKSEVEISNFSNPKSEKQNLSADSNSEAVPTIATKRRSKGKVSTSSINVHSENEAAATSSRKIHHKKKMLQSSTGYTDRATHETAAKEYAANDSGNDPRNTENKNANNVAKGSIDLDGKATILSAVSVLEVGIGSVQSTVTPNDHKRKYKKKMLQTFTESNAIQTPKGDAGSHPTLSQCKVKERNKISPGPNAVKVGKDDNKIEYKDAIQNSSDFESHVSVSAPEEPVSTSSSIKKYKKRIFQNFTDANPPTSNLKGQSHEQNIETQPDTKDSLSATTTHKQLISLVNKRPNKKVSSGQTISEDLDSVDIQDSAPIDTKKKHKKTSQKPSSEAECSTTDATSDTKEVKLPTKEVLESSRTPPATGTIPRKVIDSADKSLETCPKKSVDEKSTIDVISSQSALQTNKEASQLCDAFKVECSDKDRAQHMEPQSTTSTNSQVECNTIYIKRKTKSSGRTKKRKLSSDAGVSTNDNKTPSKKCKILQASSENDCATPLTSTTKTPKKHSERKRKRSPSSSSEKPSDIPMHHKIFNDDVCQDKEATLPPVYNASEDDVQYQEIDNKMRSMFQSPTYSYTNLDQSFEFRNTTSGDASKENVAIQDSLSQTENSQCDTSSSSRKISVGSNDYVIETIGAHAANVFVTRKKFKKRAKLAKVAVATN